MCTFSGSEIPMNETRVMIFPAFKIKRKSANVQDENPEILGFQRVGQGLRNFTEWPVYASPPVAEEGMEQGEKKNQTGSHTLIRPDVPGRDLTRETNILRRTSHDPRDHGTIENNSRFSFWRAREDCEDLPAKIVHHVRSPED